MPDYVRVATFEADEAAIDAMVKEIGSAEGPPPEIPGKRITVLKDREGGRVSVAVRFGSEEDLLKGDAAFNAMSPSDDMGSMRRVSVDLLEVVLERDA